MFGNRLDSWNSSGSKFGASRSHSSVADGAANIWRDSTHYGKKGYCRPANLCREPLHGKDIFAVRSN
jgi:hypothetical protein